MLYLDDRLPSHPKMIRAGARLGACGTGQAFLLYVLGIAYARSNLTDGYVPSEYVSSCGLVSTPQAVANVLASRGVRLWRKVKGGFQIHDYHDWNPKASTVKQKRAKDRRRKATERAGRNGNLSTMDRARTRGRAIHETMNPRTHRGRTTDNQLEERSIFEIQTTSKNLPPRAARRDAFTEEKNATATASGHAATALCDRSRAAHGGADDGRLRMASPHQRPPGLAGLRDAAAAPRQRGNGSRRTRPRAGVGKAAAAGPAAAGPAPAAAACDVPEAAAPGARQHVDAAGRRDRHAEATGRAA